MPSRPKRSRPEEPLVFFLDRGLGRHAVAERLRALGFDVVPMHEFYPGGADQRVGDDEWIAEVSTHGWVALTKDTAIVRAHDAALRRSTLRVFALDSAKLTGDAMADRFEKHVNRILQRARRGGPYVYVLHDDTVELRWP